MTSPIDRRVYCCVFAAFMILGPAISAAAADAAINVAFWNVRAGKGVTALAGHAAPFVDTTNCTDPSQPLNAWGVGASQAALAAGVGDPSVVALGVTEAWYSVCASPENIRKALGWKAATREQNGVAIIARHGFAGPEQWQQLDTTQNKNPADTMWVVRAPVCLDAACSQSMPVYVAHWYATGWAAASTYDRQAQQTAAFMAGTANGQPHVLVGDLNVWEGSTTVCYQKPNNTALSYLRGAGYMDAWLTANGSAEGYTGMVNRAGCGYPEGYPFKRIDYAWAPASFQPTAMKRFGIEPPGDASPSDHFGIVVTLPYPGMAAPAPDPDPLPDPPPADPPPTDPAPSATDSGNIVLHARNATIVGTAWAVGADATAAGGARVFNADAGAAKLANASAAPASYFEVPFTAETGRAYRLWLRGRAQNDSWRNDSTFVQFSGSSDAAHTPAYRIGTTSAAIVSIEEGSGAGVSGWGWQDNGYGFSVLGPVIYFDATSQTVRVQVREDGLSIDQIVLSPVEYATTAPGAGKNDTTILAEQTGIVVSGPSATSVSSSMAWTQVVNGATNGVELWKVGGCGECSDAGAVSLQTITDGAVTFSVTGGHRLVVGLGRDTSANTGYAIDYAFSFNDKGTFSIRESGIYRCEGTFAETDIFKVAVSAGTVQYYRNGLLIYTSRVASTTALVVDASLQTIGAGLTSASIVK